MQMRRYAFVAWRYLLLSVLMAIVGVGCRGRAAAPVVSEPRTPWAVPGRDYEGMHIPGTPVIRVAEADEIRFDGVPDESAWQSARAYTDFGLDTGTGLTKFPTSVRFLRTGGLLWVALDCRIPPARTGEIPEDAMEREHIEVWLDRGPSRHTFYQIMFRPDGKAEAPGMSDERLAKGFQVKTRAVRDGYTAELRIDPKGLTDFGPADASKIGFNLGRASKGGWASVVGVVEHVHKAAQFWLLDLAGAEKEVPPRALYRDPFKPDVDVREVARTLVDVWTSAVHPPAGKPWARMQVMIDRLQRKLAQDGKDAWGREQEIAVLAWRALTGWRREIGTFPMPDAVRALEAQLAEYPDGPFPKQRWREDAYVSDFDGVPQPYALFVPEQYDAKTPMPLVVFLHGSYQDHKGDGAIFEPYWDDSAPYLMVRPKARRCGFYDPLAVRDVLAVIDDVTAHYAVDEDRIYVTGYSAGAGAVLELAADHPHRFAGVVSIAGWMNGRRPENLKNLHVLIAHGSDDHAVPFHMNQAMAVLRMGDVGVPVRSVVYPATGHGLPVVGYERQLLKYRRWRAPESVCCFTDRDNPAPLGNYWVSLVALRDVDHEAGIRADLIGAGARSIYSVRVQTANVREFSLDVGKLAEEWGVRPCGMVVDDQSLTVPDADFCRLTRDRFDWHAEGAAERPVPDPTAYRAGGLANLFVEGAALVVAPAELMDFAEKVSHKTPYSLSTWVTIPVRSDAEVTDEELKSHHLILLGSGKLNRVSRRLAAMQPDWPLPAPEPDKTYKAKGENGEPIDVKPTDGFAVYDPELKGPKILNLGENVVATVTFNPLNRARRVWAVWCDAPEAFHDESLVIRRRAPRGRKPDIVVIDVESNTIVEYRLLAPDWKPQPWPMRTQ